MGSKENENKGSLIGACFVSAVIFLMGTGMSEYLGLTITNIVCIVGLTICAACIIVCAIVLFLRTL